ncbi:MAG TPA: NAD(P)/FAD-dependent oxidoreductase [Vicinamibacterales bacterium]|nr:NAD(P)/FAD-dependent oxidoreductase [Vicinamibacterales bacterium]
MNPDTTRVLILGGGFGGVYTAIHLEKLLRDSDRVEITLVSRDNFFLFTPMLHEVAASDLDITHIVSPLRALLRRTQVVVAEVTGVDLGARRVSFVHGSDDHSHTLPFDHLVLALGSTTNFYGLPGLEANTMTMKTLGDAIHLRNRVIAALEEADTECVSCVDGLLTFVVAGGGFAGVETLAAMNDFVRESCRFYPRIDPSRIRMVLVHPGDVILPELGEHLGAYAQRKLADRGVEIITGVKVTGVGPDTVTLSDGRTIRSQFVVWTAGTSPHPLLRQLPCALDHGRVVVNPQLQAQRADRVWALGDCAVVPDLATGRPHPPTAQHALREAKTLAGNIVATLRGGELKPFTFRTIGQLAAIGRRTGVARIFGVNFSGFVAWWLWRTIYLGKLPRLDRKVRVAIDWTLDLLFAKDIVQFLTVRSGATAVPEHEVVS